MISLVPCGQKERLFSKMQHSFLFIRSTVAKVKVLYPLIWRTQHSFYMGPTGALPRITQREPSGGKVRVIMAVWRCGESHASSFDYSITCSHNSEKACNSELILDSLMFPWWFECSWDTARFAVSVCPAGCEKGQPISSILFSPVIRWLQCPTVFDVCCSQSPDNAAQQLLSNQVRETHWFPRGIGGEKVKKKTPQKQSIKQTTPTIKKILRQSDIFVLRKEDLGDFICCNAKPGSSQEPLCGTGLGWQLIEITWFTLQEKLERLHHGGIKTQKQWYEELAEGTEAASWGLAGEAY